MEAFFFGPAGAERFGAYHPPDGGSGASLTVICPPLFSEYMRSQCALRELAIALAGRGEHVLRFDYRGTGDSAGELTDFGVADWLDDIELAIREACEISGCARVRVLGVRAGALLACQSAGVADEVQSFVLWDPVTDGPCYLRELRRGQELLLERNRNLQRGDRIAARDEFAGYCLSQRMVDEFERLDAATYGRVPEDKLQVVISAPESRFAVPAARMHLASFPCDWGAPTEDQLLPQPVLERLTQCVTQ